MYVKIYRDKGRVQHCVNENYCHLFSIFLFIELKGQKRKEKEKTANNVMSGLGLSTSEMKFSR